MCVYISMITPTTIAVCVCVCVWWVGAAELTMVYVRSKATGDNDVAT